MKLSQIAQHVRSTNVPKPQSILVYGESFTGKSQLVAEELAPRFNVLWLDLENGLQTLLKLPTELQDKITYIRIPDTATNPQAVKTVGTLFSAKAAVPVCFEHGKPNCPDAACRAADGHFVFDSKLLDSTWVVVVDSLTQLSDSAMAIVNPQTNVFVKGEVVKAGYDEFGGQGSLLINILSHMQQAPFHRVFIGHADEVTEETGARRIYPVCGTRALSARVPRFFDHVVFAYRKNNTHKVASSTTFQHNIMAGSRSDIDMGEGATLVDLLLCRKPVPVNDNSATANKAVAQAVGGKLAALRK